MGQAKNRKAEIAKLKILHKPRATNGFDMFWIADNNLVTEEGMIDIPGITKLVAIWAANPEGLGFTGAPKVSVEKVEDYRWHKDGVKVTLKWDNYTTIDITKALTRLRYIICGPINEINPFPSYSGAEFYCRAEVIEEITNELKAVA